MLRVVTWNVLHRVHAINWKEAPVEAFPDEAERIAAVTARVVAMFEGGADVVCLQEVSGDQLASLRAAAPPGVTIFEHRYPRVPKVRDGGLPGLEDLHEHLVTLARGGEPARVASGTSGKDPGKGFLAVSRGGIEVMNTHVSFGERGARQLRELGERARAARPGAVIVGDFNATREAVLEGLGREIMVAELPPDRPTRIPASGHHGKWIDHVCARGLSIESVSVGDAELTSDHNPVSAALSRS